MSYTDRVAWYEWMIKFAKKKGYISDWAREKMSKIEREIYVGHDRQKDSDGTRHRNG